MKRAYWFLLLFGIWCVACALWYMFAVKGLSTDLQYFAPHPRLIAITEILIMLLIACLIGYGIGWGIQTGPVESLRQSVDDLESKSIALRESKKEITRELELARAHLGQIQQAARNDIAAATRKVEAAGREIGEMQRELNKLKSSTTDKSILDALEIEAVALRSNIKQLEFQNQQLEEKASKLQHEIDLTIALGRKSVEPTHPFVRPAAEDEKDDLTVIKGIGPFIEKRLNMVGIYTLLQISELTPQTIEQVTKAIEFFPNRMVKDDWVGQAKALIKE